MDTDRLRKYYARLNPDERLPLLLAAGARGDEVERQRLLDSAPRLTWRVPHHYLLSRNLRLLADVHAVLLLELAIKFWQFWGLWQAESRRYSGKPQADKRRARSKAGPKVGPKAGKRRSRASRISEKELRLHSLTRYFASQFVTHLEGWKQFCNERHLDPYAFCHLVSRDAVIELTAFEARDWAFTAEEAQWFIRSETTPHPDDPTKARAPLPVDCPDAIARTLHAFLKDLS